LPQYTGFVDRSSATGRKVVGRLLRTERNTLAVAIMLTDTDRITEQPRLDDPSLTAEVVTAAQHVRTFTRSVRMA